MDEYRASPETLTDEERELIASVALSLDAQTEWAALKQEAQANGRDSSTREDA